MNPQVPEDKQGQLQFEDLINPSIVKIIDNAREMGMIFLNNGCNSMIASFRSINWLYHELEEFREKIGQLESNKKQLDQKNQKDQEDRFSLAEKRILDLENYNHNLENKMISIINSINDNILSLTGVLIARGMMGEDEDKDRGRVRTDEEVSTNITFTRMDQDAYKTQE